MQRARPNGGYRGSRRQVCGRDSPRPSTIAQLAQSALLFVASRTPAAAPRAWSFAQHRGTSAASRARGSHCTALHVLRTAGAHKQLRDARRRMRCASADRQQELDEFRTPLTSHGGHQRSRVFRDAPDLARAPRLVATRGTPLRKTPSIQQSSTRRDLLKQNTYDVRVARRRRPRRV